jgi:hypothetical protein
MDDRDRDRIERLLPRHDELRDLWERHRSLECELAALDAQRFLTPDEQLRRKELQKLKLAGRDRIQRILDSSEEW